MGSIAALWDKVKAKVRAARFSSQKKTDTEHLAQNKAADVQQSPPPKHKSIAEDENPRLGVAVDMPEPKTTMGKRLDKGEVQVWEAKEVSRSIECAGDICAFHDCHCLPSQACLLKVTSSN